MNLTAAPAPYIEERSVRSFMRQVNANSAWLLFARLITQLQLLVFTLLVARGLGTAGFGQYALVAAVMVVGNVATTFGTDTLLIRDVARAAPAASVALIPAAVWLQLALSVTWIGALLFGAALFTGLSPEVVQVLELYSLSLIPLAFFTVFTSVLRAHERMDLYLILNVGMAAVQLGGAWLVLNYDPRLVSLIMLMNGVQVFGALLAGIICRFGLPVLTLKVQVTRRQLQHIVRLAWPFALLSVLAVLYQRLGVLMIAALSGDEQTGWFTAAARVIEPLKIVHLSLLGALLPTLSRLGAQSASGARLFKRTFFGLLAISAALAVALSVLAQPIVALLYGADYAPSDRVLRMLAISLIPYAISASLAVRLVTQGQERRLMWITALTLVIAFVLNRWLVPIHGSIGAAVPAVVAECFQAGALLWLKR